MYLMYVDESGDCGLIKSPTRYFVLTGLVVHELRWRETLERIVDFRRRMKLRFGLRLRDELHAGAFISHPGELAQRIKRNDRLTILRSLADEMAAIDDLNLVNIVIDKQGKPPEYDVFEMAWKALIQRFQNTIAHRNFSGPNNPDERGMIFPDFTDTKKLIQLLRKMRHYNPIPNQVGYGNRNLIVDRVIEDPNFRDSAQSYFVQMADLAAYLLYQQLAPNSYMKKTNGKNYFNKLNPILCKVASPRDPCGIVRL